MTKIYMIENIYLSYIREVRRIQIHVVGSIYNNEELAEMETVAKVFVIEERMIGLTYDLRSENVIVNSPQKIPKKTNKPKNSYNSNLRLLSVRGFN
jgi:hypothetical protein